MASDTKVLLIGGVADRQMVTVLHGDSVIMGDPVMGRTHYSIARLTGSTKSFHVGVPLDRSLDGDWIMEQLLASYGDGR